MGLLTTLFEKRLTLTDPTQWLEMGFRSTVSGAHVSEHSSLQNTAVFACIRILAEAEASLPLILYQRRADRGKERANGHRLYPLLHDLPNPEMTAMELREVLTSHLALWGNAYAEIERDNGGRIIALWPLRPDKTKPKRVNGQLSYVIELTGGQSVGLPFNRVMHLKGLGYDGTVGYSPISLARQAIGLNLAMEEFGARFFGNGARPGVILEHPGTLSDKAYSRLQQSWEDRHQGLANAHRLAILEEGMKVETIGIPPEEAQFLQSRRFGIEEIARLYRIPPHMLADLERATFSNIEHLSLEFVTYTLQPWLVRWEQAIYRDLLSASDRQQYFAEHLVAGLLRGDTLSRYQAYAQGRQNGWLSANDIRELENLNPVAGGDVYLVPLNMVPAEQAGAGGQGSGVGGQRSALDLRSLPPEPSYEARAQSVAVGRRKVARIYQRLFEEAAGRVVKRETADVRRAVEKYLTKRDAFSFETWLKSFYKEHEAFWIRQIMPVLLAYADQAGLLVGNELEQEPKSSEDIRQFIEAYAAALASREANSSRLQLMSILDEAIQANVEPQPLLTGRLDEWDEKRAGKVGRHETFNALNALTLTFYGLFQITRKRWVATGETCPYCRALNGTVVEIEKVFLGKDTDFQPEGADRPLSSRVDLGHPPAHGGCDCVVIAER